jgi:hypothetical protein
VFKEGPLVRRVSKSVDLSNKNRSLPEIKTNFSKQNMTWLSFSSQSNGPFSVGLRFPDVNGPLEVEICTPLLNFPETL